MSSNRITTHKFVENLCKSLGVTFEFMLGITKPLLQHYCLGKSEEGYIRALVMIDGDKRAIRRRYIEIVRHPERFTEMDITVFAIAVACSSWFPEKSDSILKEIKMLVPDGKALVFILENAFLAEEAMTDLLIQKKMNLTPGTYDRRKKDAIAVYGAYILDYAIRREKEDIEKGIIDPPDFEL